MPTPTEIEERRANNRERMQRAMPEFFAFITELQRRGMFGRLTKLEIEE